MKQIPVLKKEIRVKKSIIDQLASCQILEKSLCNI